MSGYTLGEIIVWLVLAALLGGVLGWLLRTLKCRSEHGSETLDRTEKGSGSLDRKESDVAPAASGASTSAASVNGGSTSASSFANVEGPSQNTEPEKAGAVQVDDQASSATATGSFEPDKHPNSAKPLAGGAAPGPEWVVKGNADSMIYHVPGGRSYGATVAETWFRTAEDAQAAGFRAPKR